MSLRRSLFFVPLLLCGLTGCTHEAALDKAIASGDVSKMKGLCEGMKLGFQKPVPEETKERACQAYNEQERAQVAKLSCAEVTAVYEKGGQHRTDETRAAYYGRFAECGQWLSFWTGNWDKKFIEPLQQREAKTKKGEAGLRATITSASPNALSSIVSHLKSLEESGGPDVSNELASVYDRADPHDVATIYRYLTRHKHPKAQALTTQYLASADPATRSLGCWGAGELGDDRFRETVSQLAATDSYSEGEIEQGRFVSQRYVVRDQCHQALGKIARR